MADYNGVQIDPNLQAMINYLHGQGSAPQGQPYAPITALGTSDPAAPAPAASTTPATTATPAVPAAVPPSAATPAMVRALRHGGAGRYMGGPRMMGHPGDMSPGGPGFHGLPLSGNQGYVPGHGYYGQPPATPGMGSGVPATMGATGGSTPGMDDWINGTGALGQDHSQLGAWDMLNRASMSATGHPMDMIHNNALDQQISGSSDPFSEAQKYAQAQGWNTSGYTGWHPGATTLANDAIPGASPTGMSPQTAGAAQPQASQTSAPGQPPQGTGPTTGDNGVYPNPAASKSTPPQAANGMQPATTAKPFGKSTPPPNNQNNTTYSY